MNVSMFDEGMVLRGATRPQAETLSSLTPFTMMVTPSTVITPAGVYMLVRLGSTARLLCCEDCGEMTTSRLLKRREGSLPPRMLCPVCDGEHLTDITEDCDTRHVHDDALRSA